MKFNTLSSLLFIVSLFCFCTSALGINASIEAGHAKRDTRARIGRIAYPSDFYVTKDGDCYVVNKLGIILKTTISSSQWTVLKESKDRLEDPQYHSIHEMSDKSLVISGSRAYRDTLGSIYRSENGGKTFDNSCTRTKYIDAMYTDEDSKLWAVDIDQNLYYSVDAGKTWTIKPIYASLEEKKKQRTSDIFFEADGRTGYVTTHKNLILKTTNNGLSFVKIPTPGDQDPNKSKEYGIAWVKHFRPVGNHYFVKQYNNVYMSDKDDINWHKIDTLKWFDRTDNGDLMAITTNNNVVLFDSDLKLKWSQNIPNDVINTQIMLKYVRNDRIYLLMDNYNICSVGIDGLKMHEIYSDKKIDYTDTDLKYYFKPDTLNGNFYLADGNDIMCKDRSGTWFRLASISGDIKNMWKKEECLYVSDRNFNKYKVNIDNCTVEPYVSNVTELDDLKVVNFVLEKVEGGCIGSPFQVGAIYENEKGQFIQKIDVNTFKNRKEKCREIPEKINAADVDSLFRAVVLSMKGFEDTIKFNVSEEDKKECLEYIDKLVKADEIKKEEISFYKSFVDTVDRIDQKTVFRILSLGNPYSITSTARHEKTFVFLLSNGNFLIVKNIASNPGYVCTPWRASYKGEDFLIKSVNVGMLLDKATGGVFLPKPCNKKCHAIYKIANYFYRQQ